MNLSNRIRNLLLKIPPQTVRLLIWSISFLVIILRIVNGELRAGIDTLSIILLAIALLAILKENIYELLKQIEYVGWAGTKIPTQLKSKLENVESNPEYEKLNLPLKEIYEKYLQNTKTAKERVLKIDYAIEEILRKVLANSGTKKNLIPINQNKLIKKIQSYKALDEDVIQLVQVYYDTKSKIILTERNADSYENVGLRILRILEEILFTKEIKVKHKFTGEPHGISTSKDWLVVAEETIALYTSISLLDSIGQAFPIKDLELENFKVFENFKGAKVEAELIKLEKLSSKSIPIRIIIALDTSPSMEGRKFESAKKASNIFLNSIVELKNQHKADLKVAILPIWGENLNSNHFLKSRNGIWFDNFEVLKRRINNLELRDSTPLWESINLSLDELSKLDCYPLIVCVSDGADNGNLVSYEEIIKKVKEKKIPIYTIGYNEFDSPSPDEDFPKLIDIAKYSGAGDEGIGAFIKVAPKNIPNIFSNIATSIINLYGLFWKATDAKKNSVVNVEVEIEYETKIFGNFKMVKQKQYKKK